MWAHFDAGYSEKEFFLEQEFVLQGESAHHYCKVVRIKPNEEILLLDGRGLKIKTQVSQVLKDSIKLTVKNIEKVLPSFSIDIAVGLVKKESMEEVVRQATELGVRSIIPLETQFSQRYDFNPERMAKIITSAMEQSNNPFRPSLSPTQDLKKLELNNYKTIFYFSSTAKNNSPGIFSPKNFEKLIILGPEGGFSAEEDEYLSALSQVKKIHLPTPILRTPTALPVSMGILLREYI